jgi:hypothetical protein
MHQCPIVFAKSLLQCLLVLVLELVLLCLGVRSEKVCHLIDGASDFLVPHLVVLQRVVVEDVSVVL